MYGKNSFNKGFKGKGGKSCNAPHSQGKRGRDAYEDDKRDKEVRQKSWHANSTFVAEAWAKSFQLRAYVRKLILDEVTTLLNTLKQTDKERLPTENAKYQL
jgi:hypothetical protein